MVAWGFLGGIPGLGKLFAPASQATSVGQDDPSKGRRRKERVPWSKGMGPVCGLGVAAGLALGPALYQQERKRLAAFEGALGSPFCQLAALPFASISAATVAPPTETAGAAEVATEPATGLQFPRKLNARKPCCKGPDKFLELSGLGLRTKRLLGLANIRVYAFGVYLDPLELRAQLGSKYQGVPMDSLRASKWLMEDLLSADVPVVVRLVISYKGLKIGQVRNAFNDSLGGSLEKISGKAQPDLLHSFTKWFTDDVKLQRGTIIDLRRTKGHLVTTEFDGKTAGSVKSALLSKALLSLYLGNKPFDEGAREAVKETCTAILASVDA